MVTPGLLPEASDRRPSALPYTVVLLLLAAVAVLGYLLTRARPPRGGDDEVAALKAELSLSRAGAARSRALEQRVRELEQEKAASPPEPAPAVRAPELRVVPAVPREAAQERITQGLHEFRSGRYLQAELAFLRAVPDGYGYVALTCFVRGEVREAVLYLGRALAADPDWLRRVKPRDLFGAAQEYDQALRALEERTVQDPLDADAKTLLAWFRLHDKGAEYAKALLVEASNAKPDHAEARRLLEALGP